MYRNIFFGVSFWFLFNYLLLTGYVTSAFRITRQLEAMDEGNENDNRTDFLLNSVEDNTTSSTEGNDLFWTVPDTNETTEESVIPPMEDQQVDLEEDNQNDTNEKEEIKVQESDFPEAKQNKTTDMDERIVLQRTNCDLEIAVEDTQDLKIQIVFSKPQSHTCGRCCITLNGPKNSLLAVLISNIHLYRNGSHEEVLKVITVNHGSAFVLTEYHHGSTYEPLILSEAHKLYLVLQCNVTTVLPSEEDTHFNLEVLTYHKHENHIQTYSGGYFTGF